MNNPSAAAEIKSRAWLDLASPEHAPSRSGWLAGLAAHRLRRADQVARRAEADRI
jgi:hypothetical protein